MSDSADKKHRRALMRAILILVAAIAYLAIALMPEDWPIPRFLNGPGYIIMGCTVAAWAAAVTIRDIVRWINRDGGPQEPPNP